MKVVFLDRDGVINKYPGDFQYVTSWEKFRFLPYVKAALRKFNTAGFRIFVISNQAGVARGVYSQKALDRLTRNMLAELKRHEVRIEGVYYCTHHPDDNCECRKPRAGLIHKAIAQLKGQGAQIDIHGSYFIGDTQRDIQAGKTVGLKTVMVFSGKEKPENRRHWEHPPDITAGDLREAAKIITGS